MTDQEGKESAPDHLNLMSAMSHGYKHYVGYLKKGGKSGISNVFGSSQLLLTPSKTKAKRFDVNEIEPITEAEIGRRIVFLAEIVDQDCRSFLGGFRVEAQTGSYGEDVLKLSRQTITDKAFKSAQKHLVCVSIFLMALEQGDFNSLPEWFQSFIGACSDTLDMLHFGPPAQDIFQLYSDFSYDQAVTEAATIIVKTLMLDSYSEILSPAVLEFLQNYELKRKSRLEMALTQSIEDIYVELDKNA